MILFRKMLKDEQVKLLTFTVLLSIFAVAQVIFWPTIDKIMPSIVKVIPEQLRWIAGGMISEGFAFYIITQQFMKLVGMFGSFLAVLLAASAVTREIEVGTMEFLLAQPVSRTRVIVEKFFFNAGVLFIPIVMSSMINYPTGLIYNEVLNPLNLLVTSIFSFFVVLVLYSLTFAIGTFLDEQMHTVSAGLLIAVAMGICAIFQETKFLSVYGWMDAMKMRDILNNGYIPMLEIAGLTLVSLALLGFALLRFRKMNI